MIYIILRSKMIIFTLCFTFSLILSQAALAKEIIIKMTRPDNSSFEKIKIDRDKFNCLNGGLAEPISYLSSLTPIFEERANTKGSGDCFFSASAIHYTLSGHNAKGEYASDQVGVLCDLYEDCKTYSSTADNIAKSYSFDAKTTTLTVIFN